LALRWGGVTERQGRRTPGGGLSTWIIIIIPHQNEGSGRRLEAISYEQPFKSGASVQKEERRK
jgi:hypothetical protein